LEADHRYAAVVEDRPIMSAEYPIPLLARFDPCSSRTVSAVAELLVLMLANSVRERKKVTVPAFTRLLKLTA